MWLDQVIIVNKILFQDTRQSMSTTFVHKLLKKATVSWRIKKSLWICVRKRMRPQSTQLCFTDNATSHDLRKQANRNSRMHLLNETKFNLLLIHGMP